MKKSIIAPFLLAALTAVMVCGGCGNKKAKEQAASAKEADGVNQYGGIYGFGSKGDGPGGSVYVYPLNDSTALFYLDKTNGAPSYNSGILDGQITISGGKAVFRSDCYESPEYVLRFEFNGDKLILKEDEPDRFCLFGANVFMDGTYLRTTSEIPQYYIKSPQGDTIYFKDYVPAEDEKTDDDATAAQAYEDALAAAQQAAAQAYEDALAAQLAEQEEREAAYGKIKLPPTVAQGNSIGVWGWSKAGNVAISRQRDHNDDYTVSCFEFSIISAITDKGLFSEYFCSNDEPDLGENYETREVFDKKAAQITKALKDYDIEEHYTRIQQFPFKKDGFEYSARIEAYDENGAIVNGYVENGKLKESVNDIKKYKVIIGKDKSEKVIKTVDSSEYPNIVKSIDGYFMDPFENRILVVTTHQHPFMFVETEFSGCNLNKGFTEK